MLYYDLGEMKCSNGSVLRYEVEVKTSVYAITISRKIEAASLYKELYKKLPSKFLPLYFRLVIRDIIKPYIRQGFVIQWYKRNDKPLLRRRKYVLIPRIGILEELAKCWDFGDIPIKLVSPISLTAMCDPSCKALLRKTLRSYVKRRINEIIKRLDKFKRKKFSVQTSNEETIACHFAEGIDTSKRNDLNWYFGSGIRPEQILVYFDDFYVKTGKPVKAEIIRQIEKLGFRWISLRRNIIEKQGSNYWIAPELSRDSFIKKSKIANITEKWIVQVANDLLEQVYYWRSFYDEFNIRINYVPEEGFTKNLPQAIAFDINENNPGIAVGKQRSEIFIRTFNIAHYPKHLLFTWNRRIKHYLNPNHERIEMAVMSGYPNNFLEKRDNYCQKLKNKNVKFIITLFDNMHGPDIHFSTKKMSDFYRSFLQWLLDDTELGLIIKSKKPYVIKNLPLVHSILKEVLETGRCVKVGDEWGRFPSDASFGADMACGVGISSAIIEAVIAGCRGVHYDMTGLRTHEFYRWGYGQLIFDDLNTMISTIKRYKKDRRSEPHLGDWSSHMNDLDPFRDGKGGERMGIYMRWLLESFNRGGNRDEAMQFANGLYKKIWGEDKIIDMRDNYEKP